MIKSNLNLKFCLLIKTLIICLFIFSKSYAGDIAVEKKFLAVGTKNLQGKLLTLMK